jgi:hypothetical protein
MQTYWLLNSYAYLVITGLWGVKTKHRSFGFLSHFQKYFFRILQNVKYCVKWSEFILDLYIVTFKKTVHNSFITCNVPTTSHVSYNANGWQIYGRLLTPILAVPWLRRLVVDLAAAAQAHLGSAHVEQSGSGLGVFSKLFGFPCQCYSTVALHSFKSSVEGGGGWIGFDWIGIGTDGELLRIRWWTFGFLRHGVSLLFIQQVSGLFRFCTNLSLVPVVHATCPNHLILPSDYLLPKNDLCYLWVRVVGVMCAVWIN